MTWLLVILLASGGDEAQQVPIGLMISESVCRAAGAAVLVQIAREAPQVRSGYVCVPQVSA